MSDEIEKLIAKSLARNQQHAAHVEGAEMWEWLATFLLRDLHAAGWRIEHDWSDDLDTAPRDGTPVDVWGGNWIDEDDTHCQFGGSYPIEWPTVVFWCVDKWTDGRRSPRTYRPTHWRPRPSPPKESE